MYAPRTLLTALVAASLLGCRGTAPSPTEGRRPPREEAIPVVVRNMNWATVEVYAVAYGQSFWLGMVETGRTESLELPARFLTSLDLYLSVQPIGSREGWTSDPLMLTEGVTIELTVENNLALSHFMLYE
jgi:hypothetical protein